MNHFQHWAQFECNWLPWYHEFCYFNDSLPCSIRFSLVWWFIIFMNEWCTLSCFCNQIFMLLVLCLTACWLSFFFVFLLGRLPWDLKYFISSFFHFLFFRIFFLFFFYILLVLFLLFLFLSWLFFCFFAWRLLRFLQWYIFLFFLFWLWFILFFFNLLFGFFLFLFLSLKLFPLSFTFFSWLFLSNPFPLLSFFLSF